MTPQELKDQVEQAKQAFNDAVTAARAAGIVVNLWISTGNPGEVGPSKLASDFGA